MKAFVLALLALSAFSASAASSYKTCVKRAGGSLTAQLDCADQALDTARVELIGAIQERVIELEDTQADAFITKVDVERQAAEDKCYARLGVADDADLAPEVTLQLEKCVIRTYLDEAAKIRSEK